MQQTKSDFYNEKEYFIGLVLNCHHFLELGVPQMETFPFELSLYNFLKYKTLVFINLYELLPL